jgi:PmbA protein
MADRRFAYDRAQLEAIAESVLDHARALGARDASVRISEANTLSISVRNGELDVMENSRSKQIAVTLHHGDRHGGSFSSDLSRDALRAASEAAFHIATHTAEDRFAGPLDVCEFAQDVPDLGLFHAWSIAPPEAIALACEIEAAALAGRSEAVGDGSAAPVTSAATLRGDGASVVAHHGQFLLATSRGFCHGYAQSSHSVSCKVVAAKDGEMQGGSWWSGARTPERLTSAVCVGRTAAKRALARLGARRIPTGAWPVLFESTVALSLLRALLNAIAGGAQYRRQSFLLDCLGDQILADHVSITEHPREPLGLASAPFDGEGAPTVDRVIVDAGALKTYLLDSYAARRLNLPLTGHSGGPRNVRLVSRRVSPGDTLQGMITELGTGLVVTELLGGGINPVTGDYSQGVAGFWIEKGEMRHAVEEVTVAGNLRTMFRGVVGVGNDELARGALRSGSILIDQMQIAGL